MKRKPVYEITVAGKIVDRPISDIILTDMRAGEADSLTIHIEDKDDTFELPDKDSEITLAIGHEGSPLVDKGVFYVTGRGYSLSPDCIKVYAKSANFKGAINQPRSQAYEDKKLGAIIEEIAGRHKLEPVIDPGLQSFAVERLDQKDESDGHLLTKLGRRFGAIATIKNNRLLFSPISRGRKITGGELQEKVWTRTDFHTFSWTDNQDDAEIKFCEARYRDQDKAKTITVKYPESASGKSTRLAEIYPNQAEAQKAAEAEFRRKSDGKHTIRAILREIDASIISETPFQIDGMKPEIENNRWIVTTVTYTLSDGLYPEITASPRFDS